MRFNYKAIATDGKKISGEQEAQDKFDLARQIKSKGSILISAKEADKGVYAFVDAFEEFFSRVKMREKIILAKNMSTMIKAGLSLSRTLNILKRQTKNKKLKTILSSIAEEVNKGGSLSSGMAKFPKVFSPLFVSMVKAGEESGSITESLLVVGSQMEKSYTLRKKIRGALIYPGIIISALVVVGILMLMFVVPTLTSTFKELKVELPISTQIIIFISDFLRVNIFLTLSSIVLAITLIVLFFRTKIGKRIFDYSILRIPLIGTLVKKTNSARTTRTLSSLLSSGVDIVEALSITEEVLQNSYYKEVIRDAQKNIQKGIPLSRVFLEAENIYPMLVGEMVEVGEETGKLTDMFLEIATFYEKDVDEATKNMATIIEPFLMIIVGTIVGFFAVSMISPTYSLLSSI